MIFAVIDLGTNTFNLLIARQISKTHFEKIYNTKIPVKLGEGTINDALISDKPFERGLNALMQYKVIIDDYKVEKTYAFATSAIRSATNGIDFVNIVKEKTGIEINVIDGNQEAELIYYGNKMAVSMNHEVSLIMDIGGGSTEFILANTTEIFWKQSFMLGAARLLDKFKPSDKITSSELTKINAYLKDELKPLWEATKLYKPTQLIGSSGAFDSVVDMIAGKFNTPTVNDSCTEYLISIEHYNFISELIKSSTLAQRQQIKGLIEMRADMMVISILLIDIILNELSISTFKASTFSLKEGVIAKHLGLKI